MKLTKMVKSVDLRSKALDQKLSDLMHLPKMVFIIRFIVRNRLPHKSMSSSLFTRFSSSTPNFPNLFVFVFKVYVRKPGRSPYEVGYHFSSAYFLVFTATKTKHDRY